MDRAARDAPVMRRRARFSTAEKRSSSTWWSWYGCVIVGAVGFLIVSVVLFTFFWSNSTLVRVRKSSSGECKVDADCVLSPLFHSDCVETPTNQSFKCVDTCCIVNAVPLPDGTVCDDDRYCTVLDTCTEGRCEGVERSCHDADWCTVEVCSDEAQGCVRPLEDTSEYCENECQTDDDCRSGLQCTYGHCAAFKEGNGSLVFLGYDMRECQDSSPGWWQLSQHYAVIEAAYHDPQSHLRYRVVDNVDQIELTPKNPDLAFGDSEGIALAGVEYHPQTVVKNRHTEITFTLHTECVYLVDDAYCASVFANRKYAWVMRMRDCLAKDQTWGQCLPATFQRAAVMDLSVAKCPLPNSHYVVPVQVLPALRLQYPSGAAVLHNTVQVGERVRAILELSDEFLQLVDPFLVHVTVCSPLQQHRLRDCVLNRQNSECPFRGCRGWDAEDNPLFFVRHYMIDSKITASALADGVHFCRQKPALYDDGCHAGRCPWSHRPGSGPLGGGDGVSFIVPEVEGEDALVVDIVARLEKCDVPKPPHGQQETNQYIGLFSTT